MTISRSMRMTLLVLGAAATVATAWLTAGASAGESCPDNTLCLYQHDDFAGELVKLPKHGLSNKLAEQMNNEASSVINNRNKRVYLYAKRNGKGDRVCFSPE